MQFFLDNDESKKKFSLMLAGEIMCELPIFVCIGSDRVVSDMIGPLTAEIMVKKYNIEAYVYGRLHNPIIAKNIKSAFRFLEKNYPNRQIIVVDAGIGNLSDIGSVKLNKGGCIPAGAFGGNKVVYGDVSIMAMVSMLGINEKTFLSCAKFNVIYNLAQNLAECINNAVKISNYIRKEAV